ncbi:MAG: ATP-binding cassette domain-containing protein, partial [Gammaproteobacteria bacterium]|nr:ATP-binding cassette domain-containing protein [Gammaproteobacteria bacterium]
MSSEYAIRVRGLGKCYYHHARALDRLFYQLSSRPPSRSRPFWALKDLSFEIARGDTVGVIGRNGAGKSTLLEIISSTLTPT